MRTIFVTGFPGFITRMLVEQLCRRAESVVLLVEERFLGKARDETRHIAGIFGVPLGRFEVVAGDITRDDLGLEPAARDRLQAEVDTVFHLAAVYDLAVPPELAERINVRGTHNVNRFVAGIRRLDRYNYVSTYAVAGNRTGLVREDELEHGAGFGNHYESTKYHAEVAVRALMEQGGVPASIYRPAVVVGHSRTGRTVKYDGPYMLLQVMKRLPWPLSRLNFGAHDITFQMVPVDFIVDAMVAIAGRPGAAFKTFHLTDPRPHTTAEIHDLFCRAMFGRPTIARLPALATKLVTGSGVTALLGLQRQANAYFFHRHRFDCVNTLDALDGTGVHCPPLESYVDVMVRHFLDHPVPGT